MPLKRKAPPPIGSGEDGFSKSLSQITTEEQAPGSTERKMNASFNALQKAMAENELALQNVFNSRSKGKNTRRIISNIGFRQLGPIGLPTKGGSPIFQYIPPNGGKVLDRSKEPLPRSFAIHSFGGGVDLGSFNKKTNTPSADDTGFSPTRYYNGIRTLAAGSDKKSIHHLISRRGDLTNSAPWDTVAFHAGGPFNDALKNAVRSANWVSRGIELEEQFIKRSVSEKCNPITGRVPYPTQQYAVIAFLIKKHIAWTGNTDILRWLGPGPQTVSAVREQKPGCFLHSAFHPGHGDPGAEFMFPVDFKKGDPIPDHLWTEVIYDAVITKEGQEDTGGTVQLGVRATRELWEKRIELFWGHVPDGTPLSAWHYIFENVSKIPDFELATDVFDSAFIDSQIPLEVPTITGTHTAALASMAGRDQIAQAQRSQGLQQQTRAAVYEFAQNASSVIRNYIGETSANLIQVNNKPVKPLSIKNAPGFDFATGQIVVTDSKVQS